MGTLYVVSTPIGNLGDITVRALETLGSASVVLCEDTRKTGLLFTELSRRYPAWVAPGTKRKLVRYDDFSEHKRIPEVVDWLQNGTDVVLVSDAGTPLISDPGMPLVRTCRTRGIPVIPVPGVSAVITALSVSGLPSYPFRFYGYPPKSVSKRTEWFNILKQEAIMFPASSMTTVFYCSPHDLTDVLSTMLAVVGDVEVTVARELTKLHETFWNGTVSGAIAAADTFKGELVILTRL